MAFSLSKKPYTNLKKRSLTLEEESKRFSWLNRELKKHPEIASWLTKSLPGFSMENPYSLSRLVPEDFLRLKGRWASHLSRKKNKNLSCSISHEAYKQLRELKGKYSLRETLETMIALTHENQTPFNPTLHLRKTTPLLQTYPITHSKILPLQLEGYAPQTHLWSTILQMQETLKLQMETINYLNRKISDIETMQNTSPFSRPNQ